MYFLVKLKGTGQKAIIPQKWILNLDVETLLNYGVKFLARKLFKAFISNIFGDEPDFHLDMKIFLDWKRPACYQVYIIRSFGNKLLSNLFIFIFTQSNIIFYRYVRNGFGIFGAE